MLLFFNVLRNLETLYGVVEWRYFLGERFCVLCFEICIPSPSGVQISKQYMQ